MGFKKGDFVMGKIVCIFVLSHLVSSGLWLFSVSGEPPFLILTLVPLALLVLLGVDWVIANWSKRVG